MSAPLSLEQILNFLLETPLFEDLDEHELSEVVHIMQVQGLRQGQTVFAENQEGTFHFRHLLTVGDGFLNTSASLQGHVQQLAALAAGAAPRRNRAFVERFVRPHGLGTAATPVFVNAVEELATRPASAPARPPFWVFLLRPVVYALLLAGRLPLLERLYWNPAKFKQQRTVGAAP